MAKKQSIKDLETKFEELCIKLKTEENLAKRTIYTIQVKQIISKIKKEKEINKIEEEYQVLSEKNKLIKKAKGSIFNRTSELLKNITSGINQVIKEQKDIDRIGEENEKDEIAKQDLLYKKTDNIEYNYKTKEAQIIAEYEEKLANLQEEYEASLQKINNQYKGASLYESQSLDDSKKNIYENTAKTFKSSLAVDLNQRNATQVVNSNKKNITPSVDKTTNNNYTKNTPYTPNLNILYYEKKDDFIDHANYLSNIETTYIDDIDDLIK